MPQGPGVLRKRWLFWSLDLELPWGLRIGFGDWAASCGRFRARVQVLRKARAALPAQAADAVGGPGEVGRSLRDEARPGEGALAVAVADAIRGPEQPVVPLPVPPVQQAQLGAALLVGQARHADAEQADGDAVLRAAAALGEEEVPRRLVDFPVAVDVDGQGFRPGDGGEG